ncbi:uncharacterized protein SPSK_02848 [Sporothrix schenckii 1099-18]|uniref:Uncharacterized protein n=1 Tax=Sporothrix schenckii 1099-18 TaxID=1397361 RepID=A0A0F2MF09_SPOSC|nr:uncharacterized protein SPSK_02848 [Sporothrix schenckii 1099-18]KJR86746.1 hypothetical protein SPSK_02848 [Sporothrix schenckii 1099-18]
MASGCTMRSDEPIRAKESHNATWSVLDKRWKAAVYVVAKEKASQEGRNETAETHGQRHGRPIDRGEKQDKRDKRPPRRAGGGFGIRPLDCLWDSVVRFRAFWGRQASWSFG